MTPLVIDIVKLASWRMAIRSGVTQDGDPVLSVTPFVSSMKPVLRTKTRSTARRRLPSSHRRERRRHGARQDAAHRRHRQDGASMDDIMEHATMPPTFDVVKLVTLRPLGSLDKANPQPQISRTHLVPPDLIASDLPAPADHRSTTPRAHLSAPPPPPTHPQRSSASPPSDRRLYHSLRLSLLRPFRSDMCSFTSSPSCAVYRLLRPSAQSPLHQPVGGLLAIALSISGTVPRQVSARCHLLQTVNRRAYRIWLGQFVLKDYVVHREFNLFSSLVGEGVHLHRRRSLPLIATRPHGVLNQDEPREGNIISATKRLQQKVEVITWKEEIV
ncbi:uncharacterized protein [Triticum aestivum]|uniref:uncharacterized protein n=1 Tax=Triticum aestivum TaxID=4565 RepID=UPI001D005945|nr:uncharacterized protein LOC123075509 [Triticum aestivum]